MDKWMEPPKEPFKVSSRVIWLRVLRRLKGNNIIHTEPVMVPQKDNQRTLKCSTKKNT